MTGYAVTFNKRHKRSGHLFQNRYKSVACEEDPYLLELIRYIHLNPIRADLVKDLKQLDKFPWAGHSAILGKRRNPLIPHPAKQHNELKKPNKPSEREKPLAEKTIEDILLLVGNDLGEARKRYRHFVKQGVSQGTRPELQGGGLVRSAGGDKAGLLGRRKGERERGDERILGRGDFVTTVLRNSREPEPRRLKRVSLEVLSQKLAFHFNIKEEDLRSPIKKKAVSEAKAAFGCLAIKKMPAPCNACPVESLPCITQPHSPKAALFHRGEAISLGPAPLNSEGQRSVFNWGGYSGREVGRFLNMRSYSAIRRPARFAMSTTNCLK